MNQRKSPLLQSIVEGSGKVEKTQVGRIKWYWKFNSIVLLRRIMEGSGITETQVRGIKAVRNVNLSMNQRKSPLLQSIVEGSGEGEKIQVGSIKRYWI